MRVIKGFDELATLSGQEIGKSDWLEVTQDAVQLVKRLEHDAELLSDVHRLLDRRAGLGQEAERHQRLLVGCGCFAIGGARGGLFACLAEIGQGLVPDFAFEGMMAKLPERLA